MSNRSRRYPFAHALNQLLRVLLPAAGLMIATRAAAAQDSGIMEGSRVQISVPGSKKVTGIVKSRTADSTTIFVEGNGGVRRFLNSDITGLRVSGGRSAVEGMKRGALWGGGFGVVLAGLAYLSPDGNNDYEYPAYDKNVVAADMVAGGLFWGVVIGAIAKAEHWDTVPLRPRVALAPSSRG
ncbi:MAG TPA: hypothetical protein VD758_11540, partial [Gemmatimonadaceae bacterium]|nr:hypothetical protein [Gemmatimonadaceae bacterium]